LCSKEGFLNIDLISAHLYALKNIATYWRISGDTAGLDVTPGLVDISSSLDGFFRGLVLLELLYRDTQSHNHYNQTHRGKK
jgi:hypothetical protein